MTDEELINKSLEQRASEITHQFDGVNKDEAIAKLIAQQTGHEFMLINILMATKDNDIPRSDLVYIIFKAIDDLNINSKAIVDFMKQAELYKERD